MGIATPDPTPNRSIHHSHGRRRLVNHQGLPVPEGSLHHRRRGGSRGEGAELVGIHRPVGVVSVRSHQVAILDEEHAGPTDSELVRQSLAELLDGSACRTRLDGGPRQIEEQLELCLAPVGEVPGPCDAERHGDPLDVLLHDVGVERLDDEQTQCLVVGHQRGEPARGEAKVGAKCHGDIPGGRVDHADRDAALEYVGQFAQLAHRQTRPAPGDVRAGHIGADSDQRRHGAGPVIVDPHRHPLCTDGIAQLLARRPHLVDVRSASAPRHQRSPRPLPSRQR